MQGRKMAFLAPHDLYDPDIIHIQRSARANRVLSPQESGGGG